MQPTRLVLLMASAALTACSPARDAGSNRGPEAAAPPPAEEAGALPSQPLGSASETALGAAVASFLGDRGNATRAAIRVVGAGEGDLALAYLVGPDWCGSGGCNLLILRRGSNTWTTVGNVSRVRPPVRLLTTSSQGLPDIGVTVSGGGGPPAYEARLSFDGQTYPRFPSEEPLVDAVGTTIIDSADLPAPAD